MSNKERQKKLRVKRTKGGWKFLWVPPSLVARVKSAVKELREKGDEDL